MKRLLMIGAGVVGAALLARRFAPRCGGIDVERMIERMPDNAPPKWMFTNISAIRANTDRILDLLHAERVPAGNGHVPTAV
jgi:hypothetical protein